MRDEKFNQILDIITGLLFGIGIGMVIGVYWL